MKYTIDYLKNNMIAIRLLKREHLTNILNLGLPANLNAYTNTWDAHKENSVLSVNKQGEFIVGELEYYKSHGYGIIGVNEFIESIEPTFTLTEVTEKVKAAFEAGRKNISYFIQTPDAYHDATDYLSKNPIIK